MSDATTTPVLPTLEAVAAQFAGKSLLAPSLQPEGTVSATPEVATTPEAAPAAPATVDTPAMPVPDPVAAEKVDSAAAKFAALSRREKELRQKEASTQQTLTQTEQRLKAMESQLQARIKDLDEREGKINGAKSPLELLMARGFTYDQATQQVLGGWKAPEVDPLDEKLKPFQERLSKMDILEKELAELRAEKQQEREQQNFTTVMSTIEKTVSSNPDRYEYVTQEGKAGLELIKDVMVQSYESGEQITYDQAADKVEEYYSDLVEKFSATKKAQARLGTKVSETATPATVRASTTTTTTSTPKTLTASMSSAGDSTVDIDKLSKSEALAYLTRKLKFN